MAVAEEVSWREHVATASQHVYCTCNGCSHSVCDYNSNSVCSQAQAAERALAEMKAVGGKALAEVVESLSTDIPPCAVYCLFWCLSST